MLQAETYKADFLDERRDRENAQGALEELRAEKERQGVALHEEIAALQEENSEIKQKFEKLKTKIRDRLCAEIDNSKKVISTLQEQIERVIHEKDDLRHELELERRKAKGHKMKDNRMRELVRLKKIGVLSHGAGFLTTKLFLVEANVSALLIDTSKLVPVTSPPTLHPYGRVVI